MGPSFWSVAVSTRSSGLLGSQAVHVMPRPWMLGGSHPGSTLSRSRPPGRDLRPGFEPATTSASSAWTPARSISPAFSAWCSSPIAAHCSSTSTTHLGGREDRGLQLLLLGAVRAPRCDESPRLDVLAPDERSSRRSAGHAHIAFGGRLPEVGHSPHQAT